VCVWEIRAYNAFGKRKTFESSSETHKHKSGVIQTVKSTSAVGLKLIKIIQSLKS